MVVGVQLAERRASRFVGCFAIVIDGDGLPDECGPIIEASGVDDGAYTRRGLADGADIPPAAPANQ
jgi:hypothetical protein